MNSNKRDIYRDNKIYVGCKGRVSSLDCDMIYSVLGKHNWKDEEDVTGRYELKEQEKQIKYSNGEWSRSYEIFTVAIPLPTPAPVEKEAKGKETIKDYLERRIKELYDADATFCKDRWNMNLGPNERGLAREMSNQVTFARQELQEALKYI